MKLKLSAILILILPLLSQAQSVKVACVGNSITYGYLIPDREHNSYPAQLQTLLGDGYEVRNFGRSATTALSKGDRPYRDTEQYRASLEFNPDIVLIKMGTNDSKPRNWQYGAEFETDVQQIIDSYRNLSSRPRVILLTPIRCFMTRENDINDSTITRCIAPAIKRLAKKNKLELIDMYDLFPAPWNPALMPDRLHPSAEGAAMMARRIASRILKPSLN